MNKSSIIIIFSIFCLHSFLISQSSELGKRWVFAIDPLLQYPIFNQQSNFFDQKLPLGKDWIQGYGFELLKYFPNKKQFYNINTRIFQRQAIINQVPVFFIRENGIQLNVLFNRSIFNKSSRYLEITKFFTGIGFSYTAILDKRLNYFANGYVQTSKELFNVHRVEGLVSLGLLEDVFNITKKTSLSKLNIVFRIPFFNVSNTFNNKYFNPDPEISDFLKSNSGKLSLELQYSHLLDLRKNKIGNYEIKIDTLWREISDPIKTFFPPVVNNGLPTKRFFGNFYFEMMLYRSQDSIFSQERLENFELFKRFNGFGLGYTFNFFGNYKKDYSKEMTGVEIYNTGKGWRRNLFISGGYKQLILQATKNWVSIDFFAPMGVARTGLKLKNIQNSFELAFGAGYQKIIGPQTFLNHIRTETPDFPTSSIFAAFGYKNNLIKIEYEMKDYNFSDPYKSFNVVYSIGI